MIKNCSICKVDKHVDLFSKRNNRKHAYQPYCKSCANKNVRANYKPLYMLQYDMMKKYNMSIADYDKMLESQNYLCAICNRHYTEVVHGKKKRLCIDHCHSTGKIRGLLCDKCNRGLGLFCDSDEILKRAINYLNSNK